VPKIGCLQRIGVFFCWGFLLSQLAESPCGGSPHPNPSPSGEGL
jgi:hypothetical protein